MSRLRCERCGLADVRAAVPRDAGDACPRCGGDRNLPNDVPDAVRRNAVKAVRSALNGLDPPRKHAEAGNLPSH